MTKPQGKSIKRHILFWFFWCIFHLLQLVGSFSILNRVMVFQLVYNLGMLILLFYAISGLLKSYYNVFSLEVYVRLSANKKASYVFKWQFIMCIVICAGYLILSMYLDIKVFGYKYANLLVYFSQRWTRVLPYPLLALSYTYIKHIMKEAKRDKNFSEQRLKIVKSGTQKVIALYKQILAEKSSN